MSATRLLLPPSAPAHSRSWLHGSCPRAAGFHQGLPPFPGATVILPDAGACLDTYASAAPICRFLAARVERAGHPQIAAGLRAKAAALAAETARERALDETGGLEAAILQNGGALAALRRVSRESLYTSTLIEQSGRQIAAALAALAPVRVVVPDARTLDRPGLKILARACLLAPVDGRVAWVWTERAEPVHPEPTQPDRAQPDKTEAAGELVELLPERARTAFLDGLRAALAVAPCPAASQVSGPAATASPQPHVSARTVGGACGWLATQNYDACAWWARQTDARDVDYDRLLALTLTNLGLQDAAIEALARAAARARHATLQAHLHYMQGLLWAKRKYDLARSDACFAAAHAAVDRVRHDDPGDPAMERAWVHNGQAMNALLRARFAGRPVASAFQDAYTHVCTAFEMVREGRSRDRIYLRFNLLANMSSLMDIVGEHALAHELQVKTFDESLARGLAEEDAWLAQRRSSLAMLKAHAGDLAGAADGFADARARMLDADRPLCAETLTRSLATARFQQGRFEAAEALFADGLARARTTRSRVGVQVHAAGLAASRLRLGRDTAARRGLRELGDQEDIWPVPAAKLDAGDLSALAEPTRYFGLSTSIPEIDLEDNGTVSIARALRGHTADIEAATRQQVTT
jgi:hypothetical protein